MRNDGDERKGSSMSSRHLNTHDVSVEQYNGLAKRVDLMETSVGYVLTKVEREFLSCFFMKSI